MTSRAQSGVAALQTSRSALCCIPASETGRSKEKPGRRAGKAAIPSAREGRNPFRVGSPIQTLVSGTETDLHAQPTGGTARVRNPLTIIPPHLKLRAFHMPQRLK